MHEKGENRTALAFFAIAELTWGGLYALFLQRTRAGRYLAATRTWISVVIGVGGTLLIALPLVPRKAWDRVMAAFCLSSIGIIVRSLVNERLLESVLHGSR